MSFEKNNNKEHKNNDSEKEKDNSKELMEGFIEAAIAHSYKFNEGNNGVIYKIFLERMPKDLLKNLSKSIENLNDNDIAVKMLKIHSPGALEEEAQLQKRAYDCINNKKDKDNFAKVPKILFNGEIKIKDEKLIAKLKSDGVSLFDDSVDVILMDYIDGDDLATHIYKKIADIHPALSDIRQRIKQKEEIEFSELQERIAMAFNFSVPGRKSAEQAHRRFEELKVFQENAEKIFNFMEKNNIVLDKKIYEIVNNTINLFDNNDIYHPDLHERNCMLNFDKNGDVDDVFIIDYGPLPGEEQKSNVPNDRYLINILKRLTSDNEQKSDIKKKEFYKQLSRLQKKLETNDNWHKFKDEVDSALNDGEDAQKKFLNVMLKIQSGFSMDVETNVQVIGLILAEMEKKYGKDKINHFVKLYRKHNEDQPIVLNILKKFGL